MNNIHVDIKSNKPIYQQLYDQISSQILLKEMKTDTQLPSIRTTAKELRVSVITIKKTWEMLEQDNYIYTIAGKGSYVSNTTDSELSKKKTLMVKTPLQEVIELSKSLEISQEDFIKLATNLYNK